MTYSADAEIIPMAIRKLSYLIIILACCLGPASSYADGQKYRYGNSGAYTSQYTSPRYSQTSSPNRIIGPVTSFSNAYGPVPAFGLRNYTQSKNTGQNYRRNGFNNRHRDKNTEIRLIRKYRNVFGYTDNSSRDDQD